jgi:trk system potassium uptake protein TrkA
LAGATHIGRHLITPILKSDNELVVVAKSGELCRVLLKRYKGLMVVNGDWTNQEILRKAGVEQADVLIAATESDGANIIITELAKTLFGIPSVIAFVNNPSNVKVAKRSGADVVICPIQQAIALFEAHLRRVGVTTLVHKEEENYKAVEFTIMPHSPLVGKRIGELRTPKKCRIGLVRRGLENLMPDETSSLYAMDRLFIYGNSADVDKFVSVLERLKK